MYRRNQGPLLWSDAAELLERAERLQRQFFRRAGGLERPGWEPPIDVYTSAEEILVEVALPGVPADRVQLVCAPGELIVRGERRLPARRGSVAIHRLEIPYGRFERRLALPEGAWDLVAQEISNGCLQLLLARR